MMPQPYCFHTLQQRRNWILNLIVLALLMQWAFLWYRSLNRDEWVMAFIPNHALSAASRLQTLTLVIYQNQIDTFRIPEYDSVASDSFEAASFEDFLHNHLLLESPVGAIYSGRNAANNGRILAIAVPYWSLTMFTVLAYLTIGPLHRWRHCRLDNGKRGTH